MKYLSQKQRLIVLFGEIICLCAASWLAFGTVFPASDSKGFWFYSALVGLILGNRLDTPFFAKPSDVVLYSLPAALALALVCDWSRWDDWSKLSFAAALLYIILCFIMGVVAILTFNPALREPSVTSRVSAVLADYFGTPKLIFSAVVIFAIIAFHRVSSSEAITIAMAWLLTGVLSPIESLIKVVHKLRGVLKRRDGVEVIGIVAAYQVPGVYLIRTERSEITQGTVLNIRDPFRSSRLAFAIDFVGRDEGLLLRAVEIDDVELPEEKIRELNEQPDNTVSSIGSAIPALESCRLIRQRDRFLGLVTKNTTIGEVQIEVVDNTSIEEGCLVEAQINNKTVLYQVLNGMTQEEIVQHKNTFGYSRANAFKIGTWDDGASKFITTKWLPTINSPVFLRKKRKYTVKKESIGCFPGSDYGASIRSTDVLVTHNTAILGVLGVGKSMLAFELIERIVQSGIKVICIDVTGQHQKELLGVYRDDVELPIADRLLRASSVNIDNWNEDPQKGGSLPSFRSQLSSDINEFLKPDYVGSIKIYNPAAFRVTKQDDPPKSYNIAGDWQRSAVLADLTPAEITRYITETVFDCLKHEIVDRARVCVVYEEAHTLIPESTSVAAFSDREATNGTTRAILQGRKHGLGCIVITQRTANVTKTILNQCNTIFAMRSFDDTAKTFISNYIGSVYADALPSISERHAVFFGRGSNCENPILIELNDRDKFKAAFRQASVEEIKPE